MTSFLKNEPVAAGVIARGVALLAAKYGLDLSVEEIIAVMLLVEAVLGYVTRSRVSPVQP